MAAGCGKVVVSGARALCAMLSRQILARMALRGAVRRAHSTQMRRIAPLTGTSGSTSTITRLSSARHCFLVVSSWRAHPWPMPDWAMPNLPIPRFALQPTPTSLTPQCVWRTLRKVACMRCWPMLSPAWWTCGNIACLPCCDVAHWRRRPMFYPVRPSCGNVACQEWQHQAQPPLRR